VCQQLCTSKTGTCERLLALQTCRSLASPTDPAALQCVATAAARPPAAPTLRLAHPPHPVLDFLHGPRPGRCEGWVQLDARSALCRFAAALPGWLVQAMCLPLHSWQTSRSLPLLAAVCMLFQTSHPHVHLSRAHQATTHASPMPAIGVSAWGMASSLQETDDTVSRFWTIVRDAQSRVSSTILA
jgi:hypothetical protein